MISFQETETDTEDIILLPTPKPKPELIVLETDSEEDPGTQESTEVNPDSVQNIQKDTTAIQKKAQTTRKDSQTIPKASETIHKGPQTIQNKTQTGIQDTHTIEKAGTTNRVNVTPDATKESTTYDTIRAQIKRKIEEEKQSVNTDTIKPAHKSARVSKKVTAVQDKVSQGLELLKKAREASSVKYGIVKKKHSSKLAKSKAEMAAILNVSLRKETSRNEEKISPGKERRKGKVSPKEKPTTKISPKQKSKESEKSYKNTSAVYRRSRPRYGIPQGWHTAESYKTKNESSPEFNKTSPPMNRGVMHSRNGQYYLDLTDDEIQKKLIAWIGILGLQNQVCNLQPLGL